MVFFSRSLLALSISAAAVSSVLVPARSLAQSGLPACPPPVAQEYLLLVRGQDEAERRQIASILPAGNAVLVCQYRDEVVVRAGGFTSLETANAWATYMTTVEGYESFVSRPTDAAQMAELGSSEQPASASNGASSSNFSSSGSAVYQPLRLGAGYAVLVNYGDRPDIADTVSQLVWPVGLAVYRGQAYLLADYTSDSASAAATLQRLSDAQTTAIVVDAQEVVRLTSEVARF